MATFAKQKSTGMRRTELAARSSRSSASSRRPGRSGRARRHVVCLSNEGYAASLEVRKIYAVTQDTEAEKAGFLRVTDESGEDYLFPRSLFAEVRLSAEVAAALSAAI